MTSRYCIGVKEFICRGRIKWITATLPKYVTVMVVLVDIYARSPENESVHQCIREAMSLNVQAERA
jgi:hypothetical protein